MKPNLLENRSLQASCNMRGPRTRKAMMSTIKSYGCVTALSMLVGCLTAASSACMLLVVSVSSLSSAQLKPLLLSTHSFMPATFLVSVVCSNGNGFALVAGVGAECGACTFIVCFASGTGVRLLLLLAVSVFGGYFVGG